MHIQLNRAWLLPTVTGVAGLALGAGAGYGLSTMRSKRQYQELEEGYIDLQGKIVHLGQQLKERTTAIEAFTEKLDELAEMEQFRADLKERASHPSVAPEKEPAEVISIFKNDDVEEWDQDKENAKRDKLQGQPFVISVEEFQSDEFGFTQRTVTYYAKDNTLVDEQDVPIYNHSHVVGELPFGYGSGDPNVVYIRNLRNKTEYEVLRDDGSYAEVVQGLSADQALEDEIRHSAYHRRFRQDD